MTKKRPRLAKHLEAALAKRQIDLLIENVVYLDVFHCEWRKGCISIFDGMIVDVSESIGSDVSAKKRINANGLYLVPGFVDAHVHVESSMMLPESFEKAVLQCGTTTAICDPHELANVQGIKGIEYFLKASHLMAERGGLDLWVMLSSCVPATHLETNGGGSIKAQALRALKPHRRALGLAEVMNMPGVIYGDPGVHDKIESFSSMPLDGHAPQLRGRELSAYALTGISSCHESTELNEASEKLSKGISVWIREGSVAKDLDALVPLLTLATSTSLGFCTDDRNPLDIAEQGHVDYLVRSAIAKGVSTEVAYRAASWSVARHYGLNTTRGPQIKRVGAIAPGYQADCILLNDRESVSIKQVYKNGKLVQDILAKDTKNKQKFPNSMKLKTASDRELEGPGGQVHVIGVIEGKILTEAQVGQTSDKRICHLSVQERYGRGHKPANAYVSGFGEFFEGAIASSVGHDSHNLICAGRTTSDMSVAMKAVRAMGGGFCVVKDGAVIAELALPFGGLMSAASPQVLREKLLNLRKASRAVGCALNEPFLQLAFLSLPVIPALKLTDRGLVDVNKFDFIGVRA